MRRRDFIPLLASAALPLGLSPAVRAQQQAGRARRIGWLVGLTEDDPEFARRKRALLQGLHDLGWIEGSNLEFDYRFKVPTSKSSKSRRQN